MTRPYFPPAMRVAPRLDPDLVPGPPTPRLALLVNPFYVKDPHGSFGKHVLVPTLALTSLAAMTLLYKRTNRLWPLLIRHRLTRAVWRPLVKLSLHRHLRFRRRLAAAAEPMPHGDPLPMLAPGV